MAEPLPENPQFSIIIPVLNEAGCLDQNLAKLFNLDWVTNHCEVIVSDGGSEDGSLEIAQDYACQIVKSHKGRAEQMNSACKIATGKFLLFLHADSTLPEDFNFNINPTARWGFFRLRLNGNSIIYRLIESTINLRTRLSLVAGGDQGLFFDRLFFASLDGYPKIPLMEDIAICKLARRRANPMIISSPITTSCRRWQKQGIVITICLMWSLRLAYWFGVDPDRLYKIYYHQRG